MSAEDEFSAKKAQSKHLPVTLTLEHVNPVTRLLEKRKQMLAVQLQLDEEKQEYDRKEEIFQRREENLRKKDLELQEALVLFNKFLKENEQKRRRADHRANEEIKKRLKWEKEIVVRKQNLELIKQKCEKLKKWVKNYKKYEEYLQTVYDENGNHFDEISSIISRYMTLKHTNLDLLRDQTRLLAKNETFRAQFSQFKKDTYNTTLSLNNDIASQSRELEEAVQRSADIETNVMNEEEMECVRKRDTTQIILASENLFTRCKRVLHGIRHYRTKKLTMKQKATMDPLSIVQYETLQKLEEIKTYLIDFQDIVVKNGSITMEQLRAKMFGKQPVNSSAPISLGGGGGGGGNNNAHSHSRDAHHTSSKESNHSSSQHHSSSHHTRPDSKLDDL